MTCPLCRGTRQAFWEEYDVVHGLWVTIHGDNQCTCMAQCPGCRKPMGVGRVNNVCGTCQTWGIVSKEEIQKGRRDARVPPAARTAR